MKKTSPTWWSIPLSKWDEPPSSYARVTNIIPTMLTIQVLLPTSHARPCFLYCFDKSYPFITKNEMVLSYRTPRFPQLYTYSQKLLVIPYPYFCQSNHVAPQMVWVNPPLLLSCINSIPVFFGVNMSTVCSDIWIFEATCHSSLELVKHPTV